VAGCQNGKGIPPSEDSTAAISPPATTPARPSPTNTVKPPVFLPSPTTAFTPTITPTFTATGSPTSILYKRGLDMPIGDYYKFVIHKAKDGERLEDFAQKYNTTVEAILAINYHLTNPVWADMLFVVPVGFSNTEELPIFVVYQVKGEERGISADSLARKLRANPFDLKYYNNILAEGERPLVGDLILVPWSKPVGKIWWAEPATPWE
ncbi:MAG: LysM peptidoglycan-binding domain-containing protein, partial [Anaerolineales bacterium]|nr:LysM peptidoglycan-binding domain-containing protein [Anaerolineales bacterium]